MIDHQSTHLSRKLTLEVFLLKSLSFYFFLDLLKFSKLEVLIKIKILLEHDFFIEKNYLLSSSASTERFYLISRLTEKSCHS